MLAVVVEGTLIVDFKRFGSKTDFALSLSLSDEEEDEEEEEELEDEDEEESSLI